MKLPQDFREFLNEKKVEYIVVGGYAVAYHGFPRYTGDIDIWVAISKEKTNCLLIGLLQNLKIRKKQFF